MIISKLKAIQEQIYKASEHGCISLLQPEGKLKIRYNSPDYKPRIQATHMLGNPLINYLEVRDGKLFVNYWQPWQDQDSIYLAQPDKDDLLQIFDQLYQYLVYENVQNIQQS